MRAAEQRELILLLSALHLPEAAFPPSGWYTVARAPVRQRWGKGRRVCPSHKEGR